MIHQVPTHLIPDLWSAIQPFAQGACEHHPFIDEQDIRSILFAGHGQLFIHVAEQRVRGFAVMEVVQYPRRKVASVLASGGEPGFLSAAIHELLPELKKWGAQQGADTFAISGRPGWLRALRDAGFESCSYVTMWADLDVEGRRQQQKPDADDRLTTVGPSAALSH